MTFTVLHPISILDLIAYIIAVPSETTTSIIICTPRSKFLTLLLTAIQKQTRRISESQEGSAQRKRLQGGLAVLQPTLALLSSTTNTSSKLTFCETLPVLRAYLSALPYQSPLKTNNPQSDKILLIAFPMHAHTNTPSYAAQGISRTIAIAVEAVYRLGANLVLAEPVGCGSLAHLNSDDAFADESAADVDEDDAKDPWEEQVPILNVTSSKFGTVGEKRGWVGRRVSLRNVVGRWCVFEPPPL